MKLYKDTKTIHIPVSAGGIVIDMIALLFLGIVIVALDRTAHSVSDLFFNVFVYVVPTFLLREWIAAKLT